LIGLSTSKNPDVDRDYSQTFVFVLHRLARLHCLLRQCIKIRDTFTLLVPCFDDYDWLESRLIKSSSHPCGTDSLNKSNRIEANQGNAKVILEIEVPSKLRPFVIEAPFL
jgi:hypothetical protein